MNMVSLGNRRIKDLDIVQKKIKYKFKNIDLLNQALTHSSFINENSKEFKDYEKFEFLGDAVIGLIVSEYSLREFDNFSEGELSKFRSRLVSKANLANLAQTIDLGKFLLLGKGEERTNGRDKYSILASSLEALFGAIFLDSGYKKTSSVFLKFLKNTDISSKFFDDRDYKSKLQELFQEKMGKRPVYKVVDEYGPDHSKTFEIGICINKKILERAKGRSKKEAEQNAAKMVLRKVKKEGFNF
ncbi:MAG TPA: ribonuclease III [Nitrospinota bacterium]|nr:ribonuclease III [Nitrospinota bacterium]